MNKNIRKADDYIITHSVHIGDCELVMGEDLKNKDGNYYLVADYTSNELYAGYNNCLVGDDFIELAKIFAERLTEQVKILEHKQEQIKVDTRFITADKCIPEKWDESILDKVIVIKPTSLRPEHRIATNQLYLATGGFGTSAKARGSAVMCTNLYDKTSTRFERMDVMGTMDVEQLPKWAKENLEQILAEKDVKYAEEKYGVINQDKFFKTSAGFTEIYYNPDANAGGQLIYLEITDRIVIEAGKKCKTPEHFFSYIESEGKGYLVDAGTPEFRDSLDDFMQSTADVEGTTLKSMQQLKKMAAGEHDRQHKPQEMER